MFPGTADDFLRFFAWTGAPRSNDALFDSAFALSSEEAAVALVVAEGLGGDSKSGFSPEGVNDLFASCSFFATTSRSANVVM